jgi:hypothetical protein
MASRMAAELLVMDLQIMLATADLAAPVIAFENLLSQLSVSLWVEFDPWRLGSNRCHDAFPFA